MYRWWKSTFPQHNNNDLLQIFAARKLLGRPHKSDQTKQMENIFVFLLSHRDKRVGFTSKLMTFSWSVLAWTNFSIPSFFRFWPTWQKITKKKNYKLLSGSQKQPQIRWWHFCCSLEFQYFIFDRQFQHNMQRTRVLIYHLTINTQAPYLISLIYNNYNLVGSNFLLA